MWPCLLFYFQMDDCESEDPDQSEDELQQTDEAQSWIGAIHIPASEYYNSHGSKSCSVLDRVCIICCLHYGVVASFRMDCGL